MTHPPPQHAGVHFPPPFVYAIGFAVGILLQRWHPLPITTHGATGRLIGAAIFGAVYLTFFISAFAGFRRARTTLIPNRPASALVTSGAYRVTRNPMYVSLAALYVCVALLVNGWWPIILLPLVIVTIDRAVIAREERYLTIAFPQDYPAYVSRVRRWL